MRMDIHVRPEGKCWQCNGTGRACRGMVSCGACRDGVTVHNVCFRIQCPSHVFDQTGDIDVVFWHRWVQAQARGVESWPLTLTQMLDRMALSY